MIDDILETAWRNEFPIHIQPVGDPSMPKLMKKELKAQLEAYIEKIIGEDEKILNKSKGEDHEDIFDKGIRNELRRAQRARLKEES